jgi:F-type H+-transporting ATPase subunit a
MHDVQIWRPLERFGIRMPFFDIPIEPLRNALIASFIIILISILGRIYLKRKNNFSQTLEFIFESFYDTIEETLGFVNKNVFLFVSSLFMVLFIYNLVVLIPYCEEPTKDINVTIAFALFSFFSIHFIVLKEQRWNYLHHWFKTFLSLNKDEFYIKKNYFWISEYILRCIINLISSILIFPFEALSRLSLIMSLSFRLFGNIFGGAKISELVSSFFNKSVFMKMIGTLSMLNIFLMCFFGLFEGLLQAIIFSLISLNNIGILLGDEFLEKKSIQNKETI